MLSVLVYQEILSFQSVDHYHVNHVRLVYHTPLHFNCMFPWQRKVTSPVDFTFSSRNTTTSLFTNAQFITHTKRVHRRSSSHIYIFASTLFNNSNGQPLLVGCTIVVASVHICRESSPNLWRGETQAFEWLLPHPPPPLKKSVLHDRCHTLFTYRDLNIRCFRVRVRINWP